MDYRPWWVGAGNVTSSRYPKAPKKFPLIWNPSPASFHWQKIVLRCTQNKEGDSILDTEGVTQFIIVD